MKRVYIVGAGGFGREVLQWAGDHPDCGVLWRVAGFLDDNPDALAGFGRVVAVVGPIVGHVPDPDALYLCGIGQPAPKRAICGVLAAAGARFLTLIHPRVYTGTRVELGEGCVICPGAVLSCDIRLGRFVTVNLNATVGHDAVIGDFTTLSAHCDVTGFVSIGEEVFMGSRSGVVPGKKIGSGAHVGAGSTVITDIHEGARVFGVPARSV
jgi:sugar O-acyltransferase (sialic acid O-acetyltransferase NeuD family)